MRWILFVALSLLISFQLQAAIPVDLQLDINNKKLFRQNHWLKLLHFKNGESEIDDARFFIAKDGKTNPKSELIATVEQLISDRSDTNKSFYCRFISRASWLQQQLPLLNQYIYQPECQAVNKELKALKAHRVTLVLASAHINSPASAFGHTFLRIDSEEQTPLISYAVSYAAETAETNGFIYAYRGISGGYNGKYTILPYYEKIKEYNDLEQRDIWEYELDLTPHELRIMALHIMEIRAFDTDYYFFAENCSYNILWLLEVARDGIELTSLFTTSAIPIDTVRSVEQAGLVKKVNYRPSSRKKINTMLDRLNEPEALAFVQSELFDITLLKNLGRDEKAASLELAIELLKMRHRNHEVEKNSYTKSLLKLLRERSKLGINPPSKITRPDSPLDGHLSRRITIGWQNQENDHTLQLGLKPAYHDPFDVENGYLSGAFISFLDTQVSISEKQTRLEQIKVIEIQSFALQDKIFSPISWQISAGAKRPLNNQLLGYLQAGAGKTFGTKNLYAYLMLIPGLYYGEETMSSLTYTAGLATNWPRLKLGLTIQREKFRNEEVSDTAEIFASYAFSKKMAAHVRWTSKDISAENAIEDGNHQSLLLSTMGYF